MVERVLQTTMQSVRSVSATPMDGVAPSSRLRKNLFSGCSVVAAADWLFPFDRWIVALDGFISHARRKSIAYRCGIQAIPQAMIEEVSDKLFI